MITIFSTAYNLGFNRTREELEAGAGVAVPGGISCKKKKPDHPEVVRRLPWKNINILFRRGLPAGETPKNVSSNNSLSVPKPPMRPWK
jgi:hypothetical protein